MEIKPGYIIRSDSAFGIQHFLVEVAEMTDINYGVAFSEMTLKLANPSGDLEKDMNTPHFNEDGTSDWVISHGKLYRNGMKFTLNRIPTGTIENMRIPHAWVVAYDLPPTDPDDDFVDDIPKKVPFLTTKKSASKRGRGGKTRLLSIIGAEDE